MNRWNRNALPGLLAVLCIACLIGVGPVAAQVIEFDGEFQGELVGYSDGQSERSHKVAVEGGFTANGEAAQNVRVTVEAGPQMILDQSSVEAFVEGEQEISFDRNVQGQRVVLTTEEIPSDTTIRIDYDVVFVGGTSEDELNAGTVTVQYETAGGTSGDTSFDAPTDVSKSADNRIASLESEVDSLGNWRMIGIAGGVFGVLGILGTILLYLRCCRETGPPTGPSNLP